MKLNQWIRDARTYAKLTQEKLGDELGLTKSNISQWESGAHVPSFAQLVKIVKITSYPIPLPGLEYDATGVKWPFHDISYEKIKALSERDLIRLETGIELTSKELNLDILEPKNSKTTEIKTA